jgi:DNA-binding transcriptional LysR family regulator
MIETKLLRNALMLAEHRNFARAAQCLNISQPTLSRNIQALEEELDAKLFDRKARTVLPTPVGMEFLKHAQVIINSVKALQEGVSQVQGLRTGTLSIGTGPYVASGLLGRCLARFSEQYPHISISVSLDDWMMLPVKLRQGEFDIVLAETGELASDDDLEIIPLVKHQSFFFAHNRHPLLALRKPCISTLLAYTFVLPTLPARLATLFDNVFREELAGREFIETASVIKCNDFSIIKGIVENSLAIGIAHYGPLARELKRGVYKPLPVRIPGLTTNYGVVKRKNTTLSPAASVFVDLLMNIDNKQSGEESVVLDRLGLS